MMSAVDKIWKRLRNVHQTAAITIVDDTGAVQIAQMQNSDQSFGGIRILQNYGFQSNPPAGTVGLIAFIAGKSTNGQTSATNHATFRKRNLKPGEVAISDNLGRWVYLSAAGIEIEAAKSPVTINDATTIVANATVSVTVNTPLLQCSGDIVDNYKTQSESMAGQRAAWNAHKHKVENVSTGSGTITTTIPTTIEP